MKRLLLLAILAIIVLLAVSLHSCTTLEKSAGYSKEVKNTDWRINKL